MVLAGNSAQDQRNSVVLYGNGSGRFDSAVNLPLGGFGSETFTTDIDIIDINSDGLQDIVLLNTGDINGFIYKGLDIQILINTGSGFSDETTSRIWNQDWPNQQAFDIAQNINFIDLNSDGHLDFVVQSLSPLWEQAPGDKPAQVGINNGDGTFSPVSADWLTGSTDYFGRQLLPVTVDGANSLVGYSLFGETVEGNFVSQGINIVHFARTNSGAETQPTEIYRFYNTSNGTHFFTASASERDAILQSLPHFSFEGVGFESNTSADNGGSAVYRFYNTDTGSHFYTASEDERQYILSSYSMLQEEGVAYYSYLEKNDTNTALYRFYKTETNTHFFTVYEVERDSIIESLPNYIYEGIAYYVDFV